MSSRVQTNTSVRPLGVPISAWAGAILLVAILVCAAHWPALGARATWLDDGQYLLENKLVQNPSLASTRRFLTEVLTPSTVRGYYQPLSMVSLMFDAAMGAHPQYLRPLHRTSLLLHTLNSVLVLLLFVSILRSARSGHAKSGTPPVPSTFNGGAILLAATAASLAFGLHPLTVECTAWVSERKTLLATFFALLSLIAYVRFTRTHGRGAYALCVVTFVLALLSKPTVTMLPVVMLVLDWWPLRRLDASLRPKPTRSEEAATHEGTAPEHPVVRRILSLIIEKWPLFALAAVFSVITIVSQARTAIVISPRAYPPLAIPVIFTHNIAFYAQKFVWPASLVPYYVAPPSPSLSEPLVIAGLIGTALIIALLVLSLRRTRAAVASWLIWFVAIFPALGLLGFTGVIAGDKYMYLPMIGFLLGLSWGTLLLWQYLAQSKPPLARVALIAGLLVLATAEFRQTRRTLVKWGDTESLYDATLSAQPRAGIVHNNYGNILAAKGQYNAAMRQYQLAIQHNPESELGFNNLAALLSLRGHPKESIAYFKQAIALKPQYSDALLNLGNAYVQLEQYDDALATFRRVVEQHPKLESGYHNVAAVFALQNKWPEALEYEQKALALRADYLEAELGLASALVATKDTERAIDVLRQLIAKHPGSQAAHLQLGDLLLQQGNPTEAEKHYRQVLRIDPNSAIGHNNLANALQAQKRIDEAMLETRAAIRLDPQYGNAHFNLGTMLLQSDRAAEAVPELEEAIRLRKDFAKGHHYLGIALEQTGRLDEAIVHDREALRLDPENAEIQGSLDAALARRQNAPGSRPETSPWTQPGK